jgi:hypothetical protein
VAGGTGLGVETTRLRHALAYLRWSERAKFIPFPRRGPTEAIGASAGSRRAPGVVRRQPLALRWHWPAGSSSIPAPQAPARGQRLRDRTRSRCTARTDAHRAIVRAAGLPPREARTLLRAVALREAGLIARWPARALYRRVRRMRSVNVLAWYLAQAPRRLLGRRRAPG